jgi:hypothetical protein
MTDELRMRDLSSPTFSTQSTREGHRLNVVVKGTADIHAIEPLDAFLAALHEEAQRLGAKEVELDIRDLEFMNSSCFKGLVTWLMNVQDLPPAQQYAITFVSAPKHHWQQRSLETLTSFAPELVRVTKG